MAWHMQERKGQLSMRILLVAVNAKYIHSNPAVYSLKACAGEYEPYVDVAEFTINQQPSFIVREIFKKHPDVIAFSCYIWNRSMIDTMVWDLHKLLPKADIWAGGPEVSYNALEVIAKWGLRGVMAGPGEGAFCRLAAAYAKGESEQLPQILDASNTKRLLLDEIPFWYRNLTDFGNRILYYESSRGCPFSCSYCLSSVDKTMDFRSVERVCRELDFFLENKVLQVKFIDRTFNCKKAHALPILRHILEHDNQITNFHFEIAADLLDEDYFLLLEQFRPGAVQLEIGIQSTAAQTIAAIDRKMDFAKVAAAVRRLSAKNNIHIHLDLIAGLPYEDMSTFRTSFNEVYALYPNQLQLGFLKVLKGSAMEARAALYDLIYTEMPPYEVLSTKWISYEELCRLKQVEEVLEIYYNSGQFAHTLHFLCSYFDTPYAMYDALASWYDAQDLFGVQSSRVKKYEILLEFGTAHLAAHGQPHTQQGAPADRDGCCFDMQKDAKGDGLRGILQEYLTYDLYLREHMKNRPSFAAKQEQYKDEICDILQNEAKTHALFPELAGCNYRELTKRLHVEVFSRIFKQPAAAVFCYENRNPLTNNGRMAVQSLTKPHRKRI